MDPGHFWTSKRVNELDLENGAHKFQKCKSKGPYCFTKFSQSVTIQRPKVGLLPLFVLHLLDKPDHDFRTQKKKIKM